MGHNMGKPDIAMKVGMIHRVRALMTALIALSIFLSAPALAADVITNGTFNTNLNDWIHSDNGNGSVSLDNTIFGDAQGSIRNQSNTGRNSIYNSVDSQYIATPINLGDSVLLSLYWYKYSGVAEAGKIDISLEITKPDLTVATIWSETSIPTVDNFLTGTETDLDVTSFFDQSGNYSIKIIGDIKNGRSASAYGFFNFDDIVLDVRAQAGNIAPTVTPGATQVSVSPVNRYGTNTTVISTDFTDTDDPGVGAFNVTFKILEPNDITELILVNNQPDGGGGLTITDNGGGLYTASYTYNPDDAQTLGLYDLYFEVSDGTDNAIDDYANNLNELEINEVLPNNAPTVTPGATQVSVSPVNRYGTNTTVISTDFTDTDDPGVGAFNVTFKILEPNDITELILVNNQPNGGGGLTIIDNGGGSYTASYTYNPDDAQALGFYDLYFEVSDGTDNAIDDYADNLNELEINEVLPNNAPTVTPGATQVSVSPVNRYGTNTTVISTDFTDTDQPGVGAFTVTFKINDASELILVNNQPDGGGGLTITDNGGGSYTASYTYNPDDAQALGFYDLYFEVSDGTDNAIDDYADNLNELEINEIIPNNPPTVTSGATAVTKSPVARQGTDNTTIFADFTDIDEPGIGAFTVNIKVLRPDNSTEELLVINQVHGAGGLTIIDNGGGSYKAQYTWDPPSNQTLGPYDIYFDVSDGTDNAIDDYSNNLDELEVVNTISNNAPTVTPGATQVSVSPVNRFGANTTVISTDFNDTDQPGVGAFTVTFKINDITELILVNNQTNGGGGLTITDNGGGSYTASYTYNPDDAQALGLYDLYFEVSDGTDNAIDDYANNLNELEINEIITNNAPTVVAGATQVSVSPVNRLGANTTVISTDFTDTDQPGVGAFTVTFKILEPNDITELILVNNQPDGGGGLTITDNGGGSYTASYTYNPDDAQTLGLYDLYFEVSDGTDNAIDDYADNLNELEINEIVANNPPVVAGGATMVSKTPVNRIGSDNTVISASFNDADLPGIGSFTATFKIREQDNITELTLVNNQPNGSGGLTITDLGSGTYRAEYTYNPDDAQTVGYYDLYFEVSDGTDNDIDDYSNNLDELNLYSQEVNFPPAIVAGTTSVAPSSVDRAGGATTTFAADFNDPNQPGIAAFYVTFAVRYPYNEGQLIVADSLQNGQGGMSITDLGGGDYSASFTWDPDDNITLGYYDLLCQVSDGIDIGVDGYDNNADELLISNGGENIPPVVPSDNTFASPAGVERIGANPTTISATFTDGDAAGVSAFTVTFKLREPDNIAEIILANNVGHGVGGVTIVDQGGGIFTASISWDPPDAQTLGYYDLYFQVSDGTDISTDDFTQNTDELEVIDAISNNAPTLVPDTTRVIPSSINRIGSEYTMISAVFSDVDVPGTGAFVVTIKVRDQSSTEYTLVNAAHHSEQDLRIRHLLGDDYEASVLWDPPESQVTGTYDLYFYVEDNLGASVTDDYTDNADELTITSAAILGDGNLLRRTNDADGCGGPASACHNLVDHQSQDCLVCHTPHSTNNIYLIRDSIQTPSSGKKEVIFKTLGIGDPFNDPDPSIGDPTSGVMADDSDHVHTGVCEVCHTPPTTHHTNDDTHSIQNHHNAEDCTGCHPHADGFANTGGGESSGGSACTCHNSIYSPMNTSTTSYHHQINGNGADYTIASRTCLTCHVDHDIFRPDLNIGVGTRAKNLRADITSSVVQGDNTVLLNSDYKSTGTGGICLSCHTSAQTKGYTQPDATTQTPALSKTDYDAATSAHNYDAPSTFSSDGSTFNANCVKCHNDNMTKSYQNSTDKFGTHNSDYRRIEAPLGVASPTDPLEEKFCYQCHSSTSNPNAGSNQDYYGVKSMTNPEALKIEQVFGYTYTHPVSTSGRHKPIESASDLDSLNRHAECEDCHNPHAAQQGTHDGSSNLVSNALKGTWGVEPTWPDPPTVPTDNGNVYDVPASFTKVEPAQMEYQICLKCHSNYTTLPTGARNLAEEINPNYESTHGIVQAGTNTYCNSSTMNEPWATSGIAYCSDCHRSSTSTDPEGPHGSNVEHLLVATTVSSTAGTPLCDVCHLASVYWEGDATASKFQAHPGTQGAHQLDKGCFLCHMWEYSSTAGLGEQTVDDLSAGNIYIHGMNKKWVYNEVDGTAGTQEPVANFINGYLANLSHQNKRCWAQTCKNHANKAY